MSLFEALNKVTIKGVANTGSSLAGRAVRVPGRCTDTKWTVHYPGVITRGQGEPKMESDSPCGFSCPSQSLPSCLPRKEFLALFLLSVIIGHILLLIPWRKGPQALPPWPGSPMAWTPLPTRPLLPLFLRPRTVFMHMQLCHTPYPLSWLILLTCQCQS